MNIQEAKNIRLVDFLAGFGYKPVIQRGNSVWYKSPFRTEKEASFKVDLHKELWYDFGLGKGGDIITLAKEIYRTQDIGYVLQCIEDKRAVLKPVTVSCPFEKAYPAFQDLKIIPLANRILLTYLKERCIDLETARKICREAHFKRNGKNYFAIAFPNISGGYEIRNRYFKACIAPKDISRIISTPESRICYIFEGFMDFLSFRPAFPSLEEGDYIVLNSVSNLQKAFSFLSQYDGIRCCLDNDTAGKNAVQALKDKYGIRICDFLHEYSGYKDLNEYLCRKNNLLHI